MSEHYDINSRIEGSMKCTICYANNHLCVFCFVCGHDIRDKPVVKVKSSGRMGVKYKRVSKKTVDDPGFGSNDDGVRRIEDRP